MDVRWSGPLSRLAALAGITVGFLLVSASALAKPPVVTLRLGETRVFASGALHVGDKVACVGRGKRITTTVSASVTSSTSRNKKTLVVSFNSSWVRGLRLDVASRPHGSYVITCD